ncbi:MAG: BlaI/MecI/CopY family transcriptional regulator [Gammaproteobacteria bacterium]
MARKVSKTLTDGELRVMDVLWSLKSASVKEVTSVLQQQSRIAYSTVQTTLRILERKGYVSHTISGRTFIFQPIVEKDKASKEALKKVLNSFFNDSPHSLVANLLEDEELDEAEIRRLKELIERS